MTTKLLVVLLLLAAAVVYSIAFMIFTTTKANLSKENANRKGMMFLLTLTFILSILCFSAATVLAIILK